MTMLPVGVFSADGRNPNRMTPERFEALKLSIRQHGFLVPVVTNRDRLIADGEHRWRAAKELGLTEIPAIVLPVSDVDRRLLRQVLNKVRGEHEWEADAEELRFLAAKLDEVAGLASLAASLGERPDVLARLLEQAEEDPLPRALLAGAGGLEPNPTFLVVAESPEDAQRIRAAFGLTDRLRTIRGADFLARLRP